VYGLHVIRLQSSQGGYSSECIASAKQHSPLVSIELRTITLTKAACTTLSFTLQRPNVDFREVQVPVYINGRKSGLNPPRLERAACWKRQEVSGMLITHWNVASWALPALALKSNYLDRWPIKRQFEYCISVMHACEQLNG